MADARPDSTPATEPAAPTRSPDAGRVAVGFFSFTEITDPAQHRAYNEWHQLDHLPEQYPLDGVLWGQRWVRSPACRAASTAAAPGFDAVHYVTCYLMSEPVQPTLAAFRELGAELHRRNRFFAHRRAVLSGPFTVTGAHASPRVLVSAAAVPFRPNLGAYVTIWEQPPGAPDRPGAAAPVSELLDVPGVAGVWEFAAHHVGEDLGWRAHDHRALLCYLDAPPLEVAPALAEVLDRRRSTDGAAPLLATPLETITPWQWDWFEGEPSG